MDASGGTHAIKTVGAAMKVCEAMGYNKCGGIQINADCRTRNLGRTFSSCDNFIRGIFFCMPAVGAPDTAGTRRSETSIVMTNYCAKEHQCKLKMGFRTNMWPTVAKIWPTYVDAAWLDDVDTKASQGYKTGHKTKVQKSWPKGVPYDLSPSRKGDAGRRWDSESIMMMKDRGLRYILGNTDGLCIGIFAALKQSALCGHTIRRQMYVGGDMRPWVAQVNVSCGGKSADYVAMKLCSEPCMLSGLDECCFVAPQYAVLFPCCRSLGCCADQRQQPQIGSSSRRLQRSAQGVSVAVSVAVEDNSASQSAYDYLMSCLMRSGVASCNRTGAIAGSGR